MYSKPTDIISTYDEALKSDVLKFKYKGRNRKELLSGTVLVGDDYDTVSLLDDLPEAEIEAIHEVLNAFIAQNNNQIFYVESKRPGGDILGIEHRFNKSEGVFVSLSIEASEKLNIHRDHGGYFVRPTFFFGSGAVIEFVDADYGDQIIEIDHDDSDANAEQLAYLLTHPKEAMSFIKRRLKENRAEAKLAA